MKDLRNREICVLLQSKKGKIMALAIKSIPTLTGEDASRFVDEAEKAYENAGNLDFSEKIAIAVAILKKANIM